MLRKWYILLITGFMMLLLGCPVSAAAADVRIYDEGSRLTEEEYNQCLNRLNQASDRTGMNIGVVLGTMERSDITIESLAVSSYRELFGKGTDGILYYMDLKGNRPYDYIYASGMGRFYYTNAREEDRIAVIYDMLDDYLYPIGSEDIWGALMQFADEVEYFYEEGTPENYYFYDDEYRRYYYLDKYGELQSSTRKPYREWGVVVLSTFSAFMSGLIAALITFLIVKSRYKFKYSISPTTYVNKKQVEYHRQHDHFLRESVSKVHIDSGGHGGGHGGGHSGGHGGGHSSGGGGGRGHHR